MVTKAPPVKKKEELSSNDSKEKTSFSSSNLKEQQPIKPTDSSKKVNDVIDEQQPAQEPSTSSTDSVLATGEKYENVVKRLMEMGFNRPQVVTALRAAFNNPDRAVEYLVSGIPPRLNEINSISPQLNEQNTQPLSSSTSDSARIFEAAAAETARILQSAAPDGANLDLNKPETRERIENLVNSPLFNRIRQTISSEPQLILPILRQLGNINPKLFQYLTNNQDQLFRLLGETPESSSNSDQSQQWASSGYDPSVIYITNEDNAAIERLSALGFERSLAIEAFFACDKNEELAANYLFNLGQGLN